jgi:uncharacterized membrane protein YedE/YeeE
MSIDWSHFTPLAALLGGAMIGVAAALLVLFNGRVAGVSGIVGRLLHAPNANTSWQLAFVAGLVIAPLVYTLVRPLPVPQVSAGWPTLLIAGALVGIGTRYGSGCTSGHGVCGLSRGSPRSLMATAVFMGVAILTVYIVRHAIG